MMVDRFKSYFTKLEALNDAELDRSAERLVSSENRSVAGLIAHLAEMSTRKTALKLGYKNLFDYCSRRLNLSEGAIPARVHVAKVCRRFPQILVALAEGRVSLTVAALIAPHVNDDNIDTVIHDCTRKTCEETKLYLVRLTPKPVFQPSIRKVPRSRDPQPKEDKPPQQEEAEPPKQAYPSPPPPEPPRTSPPVAEPAQPTVFNFRFSANKQFKDKLERLAQVTGVLNPEKRMAELMEKALDIALDKHDPKRRHARRVQRDKKKAASHRLNDVNPQSERSDPKPVSRNMSLVTRDRVHAAGDYQCTYRGPDGTRCTSRIVTVDHIVPYALFPHHDERKMRLLCGPHNLLEAERVFGKDFVRRKIREAQARCG